MVGTYLDGEYRNKDISPNVWCVVEKNNIEKIIKSNIIQEKQKLLKNL